MQSQSMKSILLFSDSLVTYPVVVLFSLLICSAIALTWPTLTFSDLVPSVLVPTTYAINMRAWVLSDRISDGWFGRNAVPTLSYCHEWVGRPTR